MKRLTVFLAMLFAAVSAWGQSVKVEGTVKLADQPVANATVQVLKDGSVAAQTTTDANGHFTVKVKRGGYTLRVQWTDANGQPVTRTVDFKAPNANLNVAA